MTRLVWRVSAVLALVFLMQVVPAGAAFVSKPPPGTRARPRSNTEMVLSGLGPGQAVTGCIANADNPFDPVHDGYPSCSPGSPPPGFTPKDEGFAGVIYGHPSSGDADLSLYCIDIFTATWPGIGYGLGTWDTANVPNVGYVARLLEDYYPHTDEPAALTNLNQKAAAVQAAIWFFSDRYVLNTSDPLYSEVVTIVNDVIATGPLVEPPPPSLTLTPGYVSGGAGAALGPFTVTTNAPEASVTATGGTMYSNPAGTTLLGDGTTATVRSGQKIWVRAATGAAIVQLDATSEATVPTGNVYLYDGNYEGVNDAQKLILAETATLKTTVSATAEFRPSGSLVVEKTIAGPAAGSQAEVVIHVACDDGVARPDFVIPAGTPPGDRSKTYHHIPAGTMCIVTETSNGSSVGTDLVVTGDGQEVTIPSNRTQTVHITDTYNHVSGSNSLLVTKTIAGPLAGHQGPITIHVVCNGTALAPDFVIPAGTRAGSISHSFDGIPTGSVCTVNETADGATPAITATVSVDKQMLTIPAGEVATVNVMDVYEGASGSLKVIKTIAGSAAHLHGDISILATCGGAFNFVFPIPAHTGAGSVSRSFEGIPASAHCTVTETTDGHTASLGVVVTGRHQTVTIPADGTATAHVTDRFSHGAVSGIKFTG